MTVQPHLSHPKYRADIDGLRAVAVLAVVAFHAFPNWVRGGFIGVDVFFVISGYLISTIIFENLDKGTFSFSEFYARRIRRIFPALLLVLFACLAFGWFALLADEYKQVGKHIAAGAGFVSNFVLWSEADYFDNSADTKPLLHLWSLGIEEQFYVVWPLLLWLAWKQKINLLAITIVIAVATFILNIKGVNQDVVATFYSPQSRFWELLSGSLLAWVVLHKKSVLYNIKSNAELWLFRIIFGHQGAANDGRALDNALSVMGLFLLLWGFWGINKEFSFPGIWALVPVLGALLIIGGSPEAWVNRTFLSNRIAVWFGLISFPLYLWHWPLLSFARIVESEVPSRNIRIAAVVLSIVLAWLTYKLIERPIRLGKVAKGKVALLVVLMATVGCAGYSIYERDGVSSRLEKFNEKNQAILSQLASPKLLRNTICEKYFATYPAGLCLLKENKAPDTLLIGDSHALHYYSGLVNSTENNIAMLGAGWGGDYGGALNPLMRSCGDLKELNCVRLHRIYDYLKTNKDFKTVILSYVYNQMNYAESTVDLHRTLDFLTSLSTTIVFAIDIPTLPFDPKLCLDSRPFRLQAKMKDPCGYPKSEYITQSKGYREKIFQVLKNFPNVRIFDPSDYMCDQSYCYAMREGLLLYRNEGDNPHLSDSGSDFIARHLKNLIVK